MQRPMRSKLFVPGSRPELFAKAAASAADALSFDLEDAVAADRKAEARAAVGCLPAERSPDDGKVVVVRANGLSSGLFEDDLHADRRAGPRCPEPADGGERRTRCARPPRALDATRGGCGHGASHRHPRQHRDTARACGWRPTSQRRTRASSGCRSAMPTCSSRAASIARMPRRSSYVRLAVRLAAAEAKVSRPMTAPMPWWPTRSGTARNARRPAASGSPARAASIPRQIPIANECFMPRPAEIEKARRILAAAEEAAAKGVGAFVVDGQMIDEPFLVSARAIVALAEQFG